MPKAVKQRVRTRVTRATNASGLVLCRCKTRCLKYNATTGRYDGEGEEVSPNTRSRHRKDERLMGLLRLGAGSRENVDDVILSPHSQEEWQQSWVTLIRTHLNTLQEMPAIAPNHVLTFANNPVAKGPYLYDYALDEDELSMPESPNNGVHALDTTVPGNRTYLERENTLWELLRTLQTFEPKPEVIQLRHEIHDELTSLERTKAMQWETARGSGLCSQGPFFNTEIYFKRRLTRSKPTDASLLLNLALQYAHFLPRRACEVHLSGTSDIVSHVSPTTTHQIPKDPRPLSRHFNLDTIVSTFLVCTECHCLYPYDSYRVDRIPELCTFKRTGTSDACGSELWKYVDRGPIGTVKIPRRKYLHQGLKPWLGRLLSRPGMEKIIDDYPRGLLRDFSAERDVTDIWQGDIFRGIKDPSGDKFFPGPPGELRLAFGMSVDGFSAFQNKTAKQSATSTGIWLVLYNLPWHLRYLPQNVYLAGVIPGPNKPSNDQINHYIELVVADLKELWRPGIFFTRTHDVKLGRLCKGLLIPIICDLLGAHQVIGYPGAPTAHYFCTCCELDIDDINVVDSGEWPKKDLRHIRRYAQIYRDSPSEKGQQAVFEACGWRWSPLFDLEYWDPPSFTAIDHMHAIDLNLFSNHTRNLFQIDLRHKSGDALRPPSLTRVKRVTHAKAEINALKACQEYVYENPPLLLYHLLEFPRKVLYSFSLDYDIRRDGQNLVTGTRWILAKLIYQWRQNAGSPMLLRFLERYPLLSITQDQLIADEEQEDSDPEDDEGTGVARPGYADERQTSVPSPAIPKAKVLGRLANKLLDVAERDVDSSSVYKQITVAVLLHFSDVLSLEDSEAGNGYTAKSATAKQKLFTTLVDKLRSSQEAREDLRSRFANDARMAVGSAAFLGKDTMEEVWKDMERTQLPSWITPAPRDWGTSRRGKLSANNWRIICSVHLPITLIRLHGSSDGRSRSLLDNFMDLVSASRIASMHKTSPGHAKAYEQKILEYTRGALKLFPDYNILPSHHAALHIGDMLRRFGPKHSHDSPYYERYINFFHQMNTNHKSGEIEGTFLRTAVRHANLLGLLSDSEKDRGMVSQMYGRMEHHKRERLRGFRLAESLDQSTQQDSSSLADNEGQWGTNTDQLPPAVFGVLCEILQSLPQERNTPVHNRVKYLEATSHQVNVYAIWNSPKYRDSSVLFSGRFPEGSAAGIIQKIFLHRHQSSTGERSVQQYLIIHRYERIPPESDRFQQYGPAAGFCCKLKAEILDVVPLSSVISHVAVTKITEEEVVHILPVNRSLLSFETESLNDHD